MRKKSTTWGRLLAVAVLVAGVVVGAVALWPEADEPAPPVVAAPAPTPKPTPAPEPVAELPEPVFTRTIVDETELSAITPALDTCTGPIAAGLGDGKPILVAEHDYCGGSDWIPRLDETDAVALDGEGVEEGVYVVSEIAFANRGEAMVSDLPPGDVVLQTCVTPTKIVMVALDRVDPEAPSPV